VHGALEYLLGALLIAAPFLFDFDSGQATAASIVLGLLLLAFTAMSAIPTALVKGITVALHVGGDVVFAGVLIALPFVLQFSDETAPTALFIVVGVLHLLVTIGTRFAANAPTVRR
jgi:VIT1/CCC1 family predicted Fe2+/Mn2+ transporter